MASDSSDQAPPVDPANLMNQAERWFLAVYLAGAALLLLYIFGKFWPNEISTGTWAAETKEFLFGGFEVPTSAEGRMLVLILCAGALGAMVHAVQSFVDFHGNQRLARSWLPWYLLRPVVGALMALVFYLLLRGGLVTGALQESGGQTAVSVVGLTGAGALVGMFSDLASLKLKEIFTTIFATALKTERADPLAPPPKLQVESLDPATLTPGSPSPKVTVRGKNFAKDAKVLVDGKERTTTYRSSEELVVELDAQDIAAAGDRKIAVANPGGDTSDAMTLTVA
ncbi:MAG TPA: IPT/TIG domain-containing protein [Burkholderiales bacterium]|nr:IPT/TIG domain-containing protein [Burkholderiales bacterium]